MYYNFVCIHQTLKVTRANGRRRDLVDPLEAFEAAVGLHGQAGADLR
jgi:hypothetical protein